MPSFREEASADLKAQYYTPFVVAPISMVALIYLCYLLLRSENRKNLTTRPRDQLLLGMSFLGVLATSGLSFSTTPGPAILTTANESSGIFSLPTYGTVQTCTAQAFFVHMGLGVPIYNASICTYYVLKIRYRFTDRTLMRWMVPAAHFVGLLWTCGTAFAALALKIFNYAGYLGCWVGNGAQICELDPEHCDRGRNSESFETYFALIPLAVSFLIIVVCMVIIIWTVHIVERRNRRWVFSSSLSADSDVTPRPRNLHARRRSGEQARTLTQRTAETGLLYSGAFLLVYFPLALTAYIPIEMRGSVVYKTIRILAVIFFPMQGLLNLLIFTSDVWIPWLKRGERRRLAETTPQNQSATRDVAIGGSSAARPIAASSNNVENNSKDASVTDGRPMPPHQRTTWTGTTNEHCDAFKENP